MSECIGPTGFLSDRLVLMATNALERLGDAKRILLLREGEIAEEGSYQELAAVADGEFAKLLVLQRQQHAQASGGVDDAAAAADQPPPVLPAETLPAVPAASSLAAPPQQQRQPASMVAAAVAEVESSGYGDGGDVAEAAAEGVDETNVSGGSASDNDDVRSGEAAERAAAAASGEEERHVGRVSSHVLSAWLEAAGGAAAAPRMLIPLVGSELLTVGSSWWLTRWAASPGTLSVHRNLLFLLGYALWAMSAATLVVVRSRTILSLGLRAGSTMHDDLLRALLRAPLAFFDATPIGRILARFSREMVRDLSRRVGRD